MLFIFSTVLNNIYFFIVNSTNLKQCIIKLNKWILIANFQFAHQANELFINIIKKK